MDRLKTLVAHEPALTLGLLGVFTIGVLAGLGMPSVVLAISSGLVVLGVAFGVRERVYPREHVEGQLRTGNENTVQ